MCPVYCDPECLFPQAFVHVSVHSACGSVYLVVLARAKFSDGLSSLNHNLFFFVVACLSLLIWL